jgi:hypothetical protein
MVFRTNNELKEALIDYVKAVPAIADEVTDFEGVVEIRESQFQGTSYEYPNIRLRIISNIPFDDNCDHSIASVAWAVFSEDSDSLQADRIAGIINTYLHDRQFRSNGIAFSVRTTNLVPAIRIDRRTWRSEVIQRATVS